MGLCLQAENRPEGRFFYYVLTKLQRCDKVLINTSIAENK